MAKLFIRYYISTDIVFGKEWKKYSSKKKGMLDNKKFKNFRNERKGVFLFKIYAWIDFKIQCSIIFEIVFMKKWCLEP